MKSTHRRTQILGIVALTLICLSFTATPTSAAIGSAGFDAGNGPELSFASQLAEVYSTFQDRLVTFLTDIGSIFAGQSGSQIVD